MKFVCLLCLPVHIEKKRSFYLSGLSVADKIMRLAERTEMRAGLLVAEAVAAPPAIKFKCPLSISRSVTQNGIRSACVSGVVEASDGERASV